MYLPMYTAQEANLDELFMLEQPMLMVDEQTRALCATLAEIYGQLEGIPQPTLVELNQDTQEISYPSLLRAVKTCLQARWPQDAEWITLRYELLELYDELLQDYAEALEQPGIRRPHSNSILNRCKIITNDLVVNNGATIENLRVNNLIAEQQLVESLVVDTLNGVVHATNGLLTAGPVVNADLANNSVNANNLVDMSVIPSKLAFNSIQTDPGEPKLLLMYRGTVEPDGTILSGAGITVNRFLTGQYVVTLSAPYSDPNYQILVQVEDETIAPFVTINNITAGGFTINLSNSLPVAVDALFSFITLGSTP
jgi:hypothetical protein